MSHQPHSQTNSQPDVYRRITYHIIAAIEAGAGNWRMPWHADACGNTLRPLNAQTGKPYRGVNIVALWASAQEHGYATDRWATYKQWQELGAQVRKGERASTVVFWKMNDRDETEAAPDEPSSGEAPSRRPVLARAYSVFNAEQVEGYTPPPLPELPTIERIERAEAFFSALGADIRQGGNKAAYRPGTDSIQMPPFEAFRGAVAYYSTLGHEVTHWTGAKARLDRDLSGRFGDQAYAAEELVAELGAAFLCADLGLANEPRPDHAAYVANWLTVLREDSRAIFTAAAKAQQATDYAHSLQSQFVQPQPVQPQPRGEPEPEEPMKGTTKTRQRGLNF